MSIDLTPLLEEFAQEVAEDWQPYSQAWIRSGDTLAWPRFVLWMLAILEEYPMRKTAAHEFQATRQLYQRVLAGDQPAAGDWTWAIWSEAPRSYEIAARVVRNLILHDEVSARTALRDATWGMVQIVEQSLRRNSKASEAERAEVRKEVWKLVRKGQARHLLRWIQAALIPRDDTEAGLQRAVLDDASVWPIYCDYLEEQGDPIAEQLRRSSFPAHILPRSLKPPARRKLTETLTRWLG